MQFGTTEVSPWRAHRPVCVPITPILLLPIPRACPMGVTGVSTAKGTRPGRKRAVGGSQRSHQPGRAGSRPCSVRGRSCWPSSDRGRGLGGPSR